MVYPPIYFHLHIILLWCCGVSRSSAVQLSIYCPAVQIRGWESLASTASSCWPRNGFHVFKGLFKEEEEEEAV